MLSRINIGRNVKGWHDWLHDGPSSIMNMRERNPSHTLIYCPYMVLAYLVVTLTRWTRSTTSLKHLAEYHAHNHVTWTTKGEMLGLTTTWLYEPVVVNPPGTHKPMYNTNNAINFQPFPERHTDVRLLLLVRAYLPCLHHTYRLKGIPLPAWVSIVNDDDRGTSCRCKRIMESRPTIISCDIARVVDGT